MAQGVEGCGCGWASAPASQAAVQRARQHIAKRTAAALANDLGALLRGARNVQDGVQKLECRRRRGDVDLGPQLLAVHSFVLRARGAEWLIEKQVQVADRDGNGRPTIGTCTLAERSCEVLLQFLYTGECPGAEVDIPLSDLEELHAVAVAHKIAGLTESLGRLKRSEENQRPRPASSAGARGATLRGRGRGSARSARPRPNSAKAATKEQDSVTASEKSLCEDMHRLLGMQDGTDCVLLCPSEGETKCFRCHRALLAARSDYFRAMLSDRWQQDAAVSEEAPGEEQECTVTMAEPANVVAALVSWIYGSLAPLPGEVLPGLLVAADYYGLSGLQSVVALSAKLEHCHLFLHAPCPECVQGVPLWLQLADCHDLGPLRTGCIRWLARHFRTAWLTRHFANLPDELCAAVSKEVCGTINAELATDRFLEAGGALSGGVAASTTGDWSGRPMQMLSEARGAALRVIAAEFDQVACTVPFVQLCSGVGWQEHLVVDEIAPALSQTTTRANRKQRLAALGRLARAVEQEGVCPACDGALRTKATAREAGATGRPALTMLDCGHIFHERCYTPFRSRSCASCQVQHSSPQYVSVGGGDPRDTVQIREVPTASEAERVRAVAQKYLAVAALLQVLGGEPAARTLHDVRVEAQGIAAQEHGGRNPTGRSRPIGAPNGKMTGTTSKSHSATSTDRKPRASSQPSDSASSKRSAHRNPKSDVDSHGAAAAVVAGPSPGWLRGTLVCTGTAPAPPDPSSHRLDSNLASFRNGDDVHVDDASFGGNRTQEERVARQGDARRQLLRTRRRSTAK